MIVGVLGAGQLARMIALAGIPLGLEFIFLDPSADACANRLGEALIGDYNDPKLLAQLAERADVVTYEFENVPAEVAEFLASHTQVHPSSKALAVAQDRLVEKTFFHDIGIPTPDYAAVDSLESLQQAMAIIGYPAILKSRTQGYDGKGQSLLKSTDDLTAAWELLQGVPAVVEAFVPFNREVSIIAVRSVSGEVVFYPLSENLHRGGILRVSECRADDPMQQQAESYISHLLEALDYVGVLALELFEIDGQLLVNEFAPRVHNSGHWTIEGAETSQFENHLRAILDLPLGSTAPVGNAAMVNFIGGLPKTEELLAIPHAHLHLYDKAPRKGRKVAHATVRAGSPEQLSELVKKLTALADQVDDS
ncbi:5-(carboxyamino)imidazole ribonucleotide synthase [Methylobacter sp.]|uniref:5-(carboxyamino)imidazole ribonucleotide synthase n=1 Tax=Methylobacter sp. TaxID=2051955 RepID=UPI002487FCEB|nr:5-(carboxyamino)imidazole ribonucleotide synthase [Methylobacter sp.]MDI1278996.1 5-(carboxyamino)imidazole ribonucleotide synthase [Methylobacter sp.]MDI1359806.1 5-(carboxyamino)imidazole ribonucleotide synthase [Methylobacter sp.]